MNKYEKLLKNSGVFFIANFGSKIVTFLMVRLYTEVLTTAEYGVVDLLFTTSSLVVPIITLCITEAVLRFSIDDIENRNTILSFGYLIAIAGNLIFLASAFFLYKLDVFKGNLTLFYILGLTSSIQLITTQFARGIGKTKLFALSGFLHTVFQVSFNILFLLVFSWGITGYLLATIVSNFLTIIITFFVGGFYKYIKPLYDFSYLKQMLLYSCPLIPNTIFWWLTQSSNRYIIAFLLSDVANGLYAAANKIPTIITTISSIFFQAWQLSSVDEANSKDKNYFYSKVFKMLSMVLICATSFCLLVLQPLYKLLVDDSYYSGWRCSPFLFMAMLFSCYSSFIGTNYTAMKKTKGVFLTTVVGGILNVILCIIFTPLWGIVGSALATAISFMVIWLIRAVDTYKFAKITYNFFSFILPMIMVVLQAVLLSLNITSILVQGILFVCILSLYSKDIFALLRGLLASGKKIIFGRR